MDAAAEALGVPKAQITYKEPTWWATYETDKLNSSIALISQNADFLAACDAAADEKGVVPESRTSWCLNDGIGETWDASIALDLAGDVTADTFAYKALTVEKRLDDGDFVRACQAARAS